LSDKIESAYKLIALVVLLVVFVACVPNVPTVPEGVWVSESPNIILHTNTATSLSRGLHPGFYTYNDNRLKVYARRDGNAQVLAIHDISDRNRGYIADIWFFRGDWQVIRGQLHLTLDQDTRERTGYNYIIFTLAEYYEPVNPFDWFPDLFSHIERWNPEIVERFPELFTTP